MEIRLASLTSGAAAKNPYDNGRGGRSVSAHPSRRLADQCPVSGCYQNVHCHSRGRAYRIEKTAVELDRPRDM